MMKHSTWMRCTHRAVVTMMGLGIVVLTACSGEIAASPDGGGDDTGVDDAGVIGDDAGPVATDAGVAPKPVPTCANVDQRLHDDYGIVIHPGTLAFEGLPPESITCGQKVLVYQMFMRAFQWQGYAQHLDPSDPFTMHLYRTATPHAGSCSAYTPSAHAIQIRDLHACLSVVTGTTDPDFARIATFLNHESGHVIADRHPSLKTDFASANLAHLDPSCYDQGFIKTYSLRTTNPTSESFAESLALF